MADEKEQPKTCWEKTSKYHTCIVVSITLFIGITLAALMAYAIKTSGPTETVVVYTDWSECRDNKTKKREQICGRQYCLTYTEPCVYKSAEWSEWSMCSNQAGTGYRTRRWLCHDESAEDCRPKREKETCSSDELKALEGLVDPRIGDGYCDDIFNWHVWDFDGGDCCDTNTTNANTMFCQDCFCLTDYPVQDNCFYKDRLGNGVCDDLANTQECNFDGGDCCLFDEAAFQACNDCQCKYDPVEIMTGARLFPSDPCILKHSGAFQDGFCHDELNTAECQFDGGDCCLDTVYTDVCQECQCKDPAIKGIQKRVKGCDLTDNLSIVDVCFDELNVPQCQYSNNQCCGDVKLHFCSDCQCKDPRNTQKRTVEKCELYVFKGNGLCDDVNNIAECDFDGGDCCGNQVQRGQCQSCQCLDEEVKKYENSPQWTCLKSSMYNGLCDQVNKDGECRFDGFDCPLPEACSIDLLQNQKCDADMNTTVCLSDLGYCDESSWWGNEYLCLLNKDLKGDGLCDQLNNVPQCQHDGGDCSNPSNDVAIVAASGRLISPINSIEVISTDAQVSLALTRLPYKTDNPVGFNYDGVLYLCGGRMKSAFILSSCVSLEYRQGVSNQYLLWRYKADMISPILYAAVELIVVEGKTFAWMTGGEGTNAGRVFLSGALDTSFLYDIEMDQWEESVTLLYPIAGHCMVKINENKMLLAGGYKDNGLNSRNAFTFEIKEGKMSEQNFQQRGPMRVARKYLTCGKFVDKTGTLVPVAVGGIDGLGNTLSTIEVYFDSNGEWNFIQSLPIPLAFGTVTAINNRLLHLGGAENSAATSDVYIHNEETGWHLSNMQMLTERYRHINLLVNRQDIGIYPDPPNIFVGFGEDANGNRPESEAVCMSQSEEKFSDYCTRDGPLDFPFGFLGSVLFPYKGKILSCGGADPTGEVVKDCYYLEPSLINWVLYPDLTLYQPRMFPAVTLSDTGDWMISGGYTLEPLSGEQHKTTKTVEIINDRLHRQERDIAISLSQHCIVHVSCYYYFYAGGTTPLAEVATPLAYYHHVKTGNFHKLPTLKQARANHVCFSVPKGQKYKKIYVVGGRYWTQTDAGVVENILSSTEVFDTETETWSTGPELPSPLAFATVVATPLETFIIGGQTVGDDPTSVSGQILRLNSDKWEILPNQLSSPRKSLSAISWNLRNSNDVSQQKCDEPFQTNIPKTFYQFKPVNTAQRVFVVTENRKVVDFDASGEKLVASTDNLADWPTDIKYASSGYLYNNLVIVGGVSTKAANGRYQGDSGFSSHSFTPMLHSHMGGAGGVIFDKFVIVGGADMNGIFHGKSEYFDEGKWFEVHNPTIESMKLSRGCIAGTSALKQGFLIGGRDDTRIVPYVWKIDFSKSPVQWTRASSLNNRRHGHSCGVVTIKKKYYVVAVAGISDEHYTRNPSVVPSVELYDVELDHWQFTASLPKPLYGGSVAIVNNRLIYFGGVDMYFGVSNSAFEYIPKPSGLEFNLNGTKINSYWKEHGDLPLGSSQFIVAIGYEI